MVCRQKVGVPDAAVTPCSAAITGQVSSWDGSIITRCWSASVSEIVITCHQAYVPGEYGHSQVRSGCLPCTVVSDSSVCPIRFGRPVEPEVSSQTRPDSSIRFSLAGLTVLSSPDASTTAKPDSPSSSRIAGSTRLEVATNSSVPCTAWWRTAASASTPVSTSTAAGDGSCGSLGRVRQVSVRPPATIRLSSPTRAVERRRVAVTSVTRGSRCLQLLDEVQHVTDLVLDPQGELGEVQGAEPDLPQIGGVVCGQVLALGLHHLAHQVTDLVARQLTHERRAYLPVTACRQAGSRQPLYNEIVVWRVTTDVWGFRGVVAERLTPAAVVWVLAAVVLLRYDVGWADVVRFTVLLGAGIMLPGTLCLRALRVNTDGFAADVAFGTGLGCVVSMLVYLPARAAGVPLLGLAFPLGTVAAFLVVPRLRGCWRSAGPRVPAWWAWSVAGACVAALAVTVRFEFSLDAVRFPAAAFQYVDLPYHLALAGELKHHLAPSIPYVAGEPLRYHWFAYAELATMSWQSGIELDVLLHRRPAAVHRA